MRKSATLLLLCGSLIAASPERDIRKVLEDQVNAWNRGNLQEFMDGYEDSPSTAFVGSEVTKGRAEVLARYKKRYPTRENMGTLAFENLEIHVLDPHFAYVIGRFRLRRTAQGGGETKGLFTLLFRNTPAGWKIVLDHTA